MSEGLKQKIQTDIQVALRAQEKQRLGAIRLELFKNKVSDHVKQLLNS